MSNHDKWKRLGDGSLLTEAADEGLGHVVPINLYNKVFASLIFLTIVTVAAAAIDFGPFGLIIALAIATIKVSLVASVFMHLKFEVKTILVIAIYPIFVFLLMVLGTLGDHSVKEVLVPANISVAK